MKKASKIGAISLVVLFVIAQFIRPDRTLPPVNPSETLAASVQVPENVKAVITRSCADCHSHQTVYPWYSNITPANWFLQTHIDEGRAELNFSIWGTYADSRKARKLDEICENVRSREMPLPSYLWIHRNARMSDADIALICSWAEAVRAEIPQ